MTINVDHLKSAYLTHNGTTTLPVQSKTSKSITGKWPKSHLTAAYPLAAVTWSLLDLIHHTTKLGTNLY